MRPKLKIQNMKGQLSPVSGQKAWGKGQNDVTTTRETESASWRQVGWSYHHHRPTIALFSSSYHCSIFIALPLLYFHHRTIALFSLSNHCFIFIIVPLLYFIIVSSSKWDQDTCDISLAQTRSDLCQSWSQESDQIQKIFLKILFCRNIRWSILGSRNTFLCSWENYGNWKCLLEVDSK